MDQNQFACLALQAAAKGLVDFSEADYFDPAWNRRLRLLLKALEAENDREISMMRYQHRAMLLTTPWLDPAAISDTQDAALRDLDAVVGYYRPWEFDKKTREEKEVADTTKLRNTWQRTFGSLDDPKVQDRLAKTRAALLKRAEDNQVPDSPLTGQGVFNRETASHLGALQTLNRNTNGRSPVN